MDSDITVRAAAGRLSCTESQVYMYLKKGRIPGAYQDAAGHWCIPPDPEVEPLERALSGARVSVYPDTGCGYSPSCLACDLPKCVHDMNAREQETLALSAGKARRSDAAALAADITTANPGLPREMVVKRVARRMRVSVRTAYRYLEAGPAGQRR